MEEQNKKGKIDIKIISIIVLVVIIIVGAVAAVVYLKSDKDKEYDGTPADKKYDSNIILSKDDIDNSSEKVENGHMGLEMKNVAVSSDGENFICYICNAAENSFDMYVTIQDYNTKVEIFKSGIMPVGSRIEKFKSEKVFKEGTYNMVIVFHQLESDGVTEHSQVSVAFTLNVG